MCPLFSPVGRAGPRATARRRRHVAAGLIALLTLPAATLAGDELTTAVRARLQHSTIAIEWPQPDARRRPARVHPLGVQTLAIEAVHHKSDAEHAPARAQLYQYDHQRDLARRLVLAVDDGRVLGNDAVASVHLPLNAAERDWVAMRLSMAGWLREVAGAQVSSLQQTAFVFEPADPAAFCRSSRCALVSLARTDGTVLTVEAVVEFATGLARPLDVTVTSRRP